MNGPLDWLVSLFRPGWDNPTPAQKIFRGARVKTRRGIGVITNGQVNVNLDHGSPMRPIGHRYRVNISENISNVHVL